MQNESGQMKQMLSYKYCFAITDWNMFPDSSYGTEEYTTSVIGFINFILFLPLFN
jgi:hypothetical protein